MFAHDLKPLDRPTLNCLLKYADDASLLSPQNSPTPVELEITNVMDWARKKHNVCKPTQDRGTCLSQT